jgi:hypothetical protein
MILRGSGASATSTSYATRSQLFAARRNRARTGTTSNTFVNAEIYIPSYLVSQNKPLVVLLLQKIIVLPMFICLPAHLWQNSAAITSINLILILAT